MVASFLTVCFGTSECWDLPLPSRWTDEFVEWADSDQLRARSLRENHAWKWLAAGSASGRLFGGNIDTLNMLCGTDNLKVPESGAILFLEATALSLSGFRRALEHLVQARLFETGTGLLFAKYHRGGKAAGDAPSSSAEVDFESYEEVLAEKIGRFGIPIASRLDIGHTDPMFTIPIGIPALMDSGNNRITILERGVSC
jgi:muramoyltetrapeptide carboxypeptidase LdcA involved in peptidoglycan recycling